jgi:exonuclease SbcC
MVDGESHNLTAAGSTPAPATKAKAPGSSPALCINSSNSSITKSKVMKIYLKSLALSFFKGIRSQRVDFEDVTNIYGYNATGKTTLMDAFLWLLFDKDSMDRKDFEIKTLDENNEPIHEKDHEVTGILIMDGQEINLRKCYREKWVKKRGSIEKEFTGHETSYFWNDVPLKKEEYQQKIADLLNEKVFKLITNTTYFNSLKWQDRRAVLLDIAGKISNTDILKTLCDRDGAGGYEDLIFALNSKTVEEYKKEISAKKKKLKDELLVLPSRIEEAGRALPEELDYDKIVQDITAVKLDIQAVEDLLSTKSKAAKDHQDMVLDLIAKKQGHSRQAMDIEFQVKNQVIQKGSDRAARIQEEKRTLSQLNNELASTRNEYSREENHKKSLLAEQDTLRTKWAAIDAEKLEFKEDEFNCPACKRPLEAGNIATKKEELSASFNASKSKRLAEISERGKQIGAEIGDIDVRLGNLKHKGEAINREIATRTERISQLEEEHTRLQADEAGEAEKALASHELYQQLKKDITACDEKINEPYNADDNSALLQRKRELTTQLEQLNSQLSTKGTREKQLARIEELKGQEETQAQELASLEGIEYSIEQFTKAKMDMLEERINGRFKLVRFKMFEQQINGGQVEACTTLIAGVPFDNANNAARIQAGLDIINTLSDHYGVYAPVWVDNRESVINLPETSSQLINLIVSEAHAKLTVSPGKVVEMAAAV